MLKCNAGQGRPVEPAGFGNSPAQFSAYFDAGIDQSYRQRLTPYYLHPPLSTSTVAATPLFLAGSSLGDVDAC